MKKTNFWRYLIWVAVIVALFTAIDFIVHFTVDYLGVYYYPIPQSLKFISETPLVWYAIGKFLGAVVIGALLFPIVKRIPKLWAKSFVFTIIIISLLEVRYILSGYYGNLWHVYNFIQHGIALLVVSYLVFWKTKAAGA